MIPKRLYGKEAEEVSVIGLGGVTVTKLSQKDVDELVDEALARGVNYFDVAPTYGESEVLIGNALKGRRAGVFLACKTHRRTKDEAAAELNASLERLQTDCIDLYQLHSVSTMEDVEAVFAKGGAIEAAIEGRERGVIRHIGFSCHSPKAALAAMDRFDFDSILFPINFVLWMKGGVGPQVIERAKAKGVTVLAIKALARRPWPENADRSAAPRCWYEPVTTPDMVAKALRFTLSREVTAAVPSGDARLFRMALDAAENLRPLTEEEMRALEVFAQEQDLIFDPDEV